MSAEPIEPTTREPQPPADITGWEMVTVKDGGGAGGGSGLLFLVICLLMIVIAAHLRGWL